MWFPASVLILLGTTLVIGGIPDHVFPPMAKWGWWTLTVWTCAAAGLYAPYGRWHWKALGFVAITLFFASYMLLWDEYVALVPADLGAWRWEVFLVANVGIPMTMVSIGPMRPLVERE